MRVRLCRNARARPPVGKRTGAGITVAGYAVGEAVGSADVGLTSRTPPWQARYYDFNVWSEHKFTEKLRYIHRNPVTRGLVARPEDWAWSSFCHYANGEAGQVEIESQWTARKREQSGIFLTVRTHPAP